VAANTLNAPALLAVDSTGRLWVPDSDNHRVLRFDSAHTKTTGANADGVLGQSDFTSSGSATTQSSMDMPVGVAVDSAGRLWVAEAGSNRVLRFDNAASKANGANADGVLGQADFTSAAWATSQAGMNEPSTAAVVGNALFVADAESNRVLRFDNAASKANGANADGVLGQIDFTSSGTATTQAGFVCPCGVAADAQGRLYVADTHNHRVVTHDTASAKANGANADNVLGQALFTTAGTATTQAGMSMPYAVAADSVNGLLVVLDRSNSRVLQFQASAPLPVELSGFGVE